MVQAIENRKPFKRSNTQVYEDEGVWRVKLYSTEIIRYAPPRDGHQARVELRTGGWNTPTTRSRINAFLSWFRPTSGVSGVVQINFEPHYYEVGTATPYIWEGSESIFAYK